MYEIVLKQDIETRSNSRKVGKIVHRIMKMNL